MTMDELQSQPIERRIENLQNRNYVGKYAEVGQRQEPNYEP